MNLDENRSPEDTVPQDDIECKGCDATSALNELGLCNDCADKLDRDMLRLRDWDFTKLSIGLQPEERENLRRQIISQHGKELELILPRRKSQRRSKRRSRK